MQRRPRSVSIVMTVLLALAVDAIASAIAELLRYGDMADRLSRFEQSTTDTGSQAGINIQFTQLPSVAIGPTITVMVVLAAIAAGLVTLALAIRQPRPRVRVITFASAGILTVLAIAQTGIALTSQLSINQIDAEFQGLQQNFQGLQQDLGGADSSLGSLSFGDLLPSWPYYVDYLTSALAIIGCAAVIVLLARPGPRMWFATAISGPFIPAQPPVSGTPPAPVVDTQTIVSDPWMRSIISELMNGRRSLSDLQAGPLGSNIDVLNWRLWDLCNAGVIWQPPSATSTIYELTPRGEDLRTVLSQTTPGQHPNNPGPAS